MLREPERVLGDGAAESPLDLLRAVGHLVVALALAPLLRAVRVADSHPHDRDRREHAADRHDPWNATTCAHDHAPADLLPEDPVRRADVAALLRGDRRRLQAEPVLSDRRGGLVHDCVPGRPTVLEREVESWELELEPDHLWLQDAK
jgi:hypothetical protein